MPAQQRRIRLRRNGEFARHPGKNIGVGQEKKCLESRKLCFIEIFDIRVGKTSEKQVDLAHAPMPCPKTQPPPAHFDPVVWGVCFGRHAPSTIVIRRRADFRPVALRG